VSPQPNGDEDVAGMHDIVDQALGWAFGTGDAASGQGLDGLQG
jgi:hypothetical protein